jgi:hypothetical protein
MIRKMLIAIAILCVFISCLVYYSSPRFYYYTNTPIGHIEVKRQAQSNWQTEEMEIKLGPVKYTYYYYKAVYNLSPDVEILDGPHLEWKW